MILAGDIGGTKTTIGVFSLENGKLVAGAKKTYPSKSYPSLEAVLDDFTAAHPAMLTAACFGVAGPIIDETVKTPNLPWFIDGRALARRLSLASVSLLNDLEATGYGAGTLDSSEFSVLNVGSCDPRANMGLIAAGTGLGEAILYPAGGAYRVLASEGGHADYAPHTPQHIELLSYLAARFGHVSYERVISGPGIFNIYNFLKDSGRYEVPAWLPDRLAKQDPTAAIALAALAGEADICVQTLDIFASSYGAEAGNLALRAKALGGVCVGGGIAPKILKKLLDGTFMKAFVGKGRYAELLARIPVQVILNEETALRGAAYYGAHAQDRS
jgi:glucokinase